MALHYTGYFLWLVGAWGVGPRAWGVGPRAWGRSSVQRDYKLRVCAQGTNHRAPAVVPLSGSEVLSIVLAPF